MAKELSDVIENIKEIVKSIKPLINKIGEIKSTKGKNLLPEDSAPLFIRSFVALSSIDSLPKHAFSPNHAELTDSVIGQQAQLYKLAQEAKQNVSADYPYLLQIANTLTNAEIDNLIETRKKGKKISSARKDLLYFYTVLRDSELETEGLSEENKKILYTINLALAACIAKTIEAEKFYSPKGNFK
ncbi:MAG: hypothetical protein QXP53_00505 [Candidatus Pacearchaeota archaeon]